MSKSITLILLLSLIFYINSQECTGKAFTEKSDCYTIIPSNNSYCCAIIFEASGVTEKKQICYEILKGVLPPGVPDDVIDDKLRDVAKGINKNYWPSLDHNAKISCNISKSVEDEEKKEVSSGEEGIKNYEICDDEPGATLDSCIEIDNLFGDNKCCYVESKKDNKEEKMCKYFKKEDYENLNQYSQKKKENDGYQEYSINCGERFHTTSSNSSNLSAQNGTDSSVSSNTKGSNSKFLSIKNIIYLLEFLLL